MRRLQIALVCAACLIQAMGHAEIERVMVKWTPSLCQDSCVQGLKKQFANQQGVAEVEINQPAGQANLKWKPNVAFTFQAIHNAMAMIGLYINDLRVIVTGKISHDGNTVRLTSPTDGTTFQLLGPTQAQPLQYAQKYNIATHDLSEDTRQALLAAEKANQKVTIEGPIFEPYRAPPLRLIIERMQIENPNKK